MGQEAARQEGGGEAGCGEAGGGEAEGGKAGGRVGTWWVSGLNDFVVTRFRELSCIQSSAHRDYSLITIPSPLGL